MTRKFGSTYKEMRTVAMQATRSYLRSMGIDPVTVDAKGAMQALDDICRNGEALTCYVWWVQCESSNQTRLFRSEWNAWRKDAS
jgi:hypothetical protein